MEYIDAKEFRPKRAWDSKLLLDLGEFSVRLHWTDQPYRWHRNKGNELFVVLDGKVHMHHRTGDGSERVEELLIGSSILFNEGDEHYAEPAPEARVLVIERKDSE